MPAARELTLDQFADRMEAAGHRLDGVDWRPALKAALLILKSYTQQNFDQGHDPDGVPWAGLAHPRPRGGDSPLRDRDLLMASVTGGGQGHVEELTATSLVWGTNLPYAAVHQHGATITPTGGRALAIPLTPEAQRAGTARDFPGDLFVFRSKGGHGFLAESRGKRLSLHYILLPSVTVPARPFLGFSEPMKDDLGQLFLDHLAKQVEG